MISFGSMLFTFLALVIIRVLWEIGLYIANLRYSTGKEAKVPEVLSDVITKDDFNKTKSYMKDYAPVIITNRVISFWLTFWFILVGFPLFERVVTTLSNNIYIQSIIFFALYEIVEFLFDIPFKVYSTFVIEEKYGFNKMTVKTFIGDIVKSIILAMIIGIPMILFLTWFLITFETWWWQVTIFSVFLTILISYIQPTLIAPLFNKFEELKDENLRAKLKDLLEKAEIKVPKIYTMDASRRTKKQNAYLTGIGKSRRLVLYDTILEYSEEEILAVVGHELGHHKGKHIQKLMIISVVYEFVIFYLTNMLYKFFITKKFLGLSQPYSAFIYAFLFISSIMYFLKPVVNYLSRRFEYESDNYSAKLLGTPIPLIKALKRLVKQNLSNPNPLPIYKLWYYTHPAPEERIKNLLQR